MNLTIDQVRALPVGSIVYIERESPARRRQIKCTVARLGTGDKFLTFRVKGELRRCEIREYTDTTYRKGGSPA